MAEKTGIAWCDSTFNPWIGCSKVSPACDNCYAEALNNRMKWVGYGGNDADGIYPFRARWGAGIERRRTSESTWRQPLRWNRRAEIKIKAWKKFKEQYLGLTDAQLEAQGLIKPRRPRVFCASLADVFDNEAPSNWRDDLFDLICKTPNIDWLLLTKRIGNARAMLDFSADWTDSGPLNNVWLGATICNQEEADRDIPKLLAVPAAKRFLSVEPMLSSVYLRLGDSDDVPSDSEPFRERQWMIDWVICGGETGKHARPMHPAWVRSLRDQCVAAGVPFFFKQWGEWHPQVWTEGGDVVIGPDDGYKTDAATGTVRCGHKAAGNMLDGRVWEEIPA